MTDYLNPWYAIEKDASKQTYYNRPVSGVRLYTPPPKPEPKPFVKPQKKSQPTIVYRSADLVLMELAVKTRKDVKERIPFQWPDDYYRGLCASWFEEQKAKSLSDVVFLCGDEATNAMNKFLGCCLVCWYADGSTACFIPDTENKGNDSVPVMKTVALARPDYQKPSFPDNAEAFKYALQSICDYAPFEGWKQIFRSGLHTMNSDHVVYHGQKDTFDIPEPYFKYLYAAQLTRLGFGMGSWSDLPMVGTEDYRKITHHFSTERDKALMYAINNC